MTGPLKERPHGRRALRILTALFALTLVVAGVSAVVLEPNLTG